MERGTGVEDGAHSLEERLTRIEDELAVRNLLTKYGMACDLNSTEALLELLEEDVEMEVDGNWRMSGHEEAKQLLEGPIHQAFESRCAHLLSPYAVEVDGDEATATGYTVVILGEAEGEGFGVERLSFNRWGLRKRDGRWRIARRATALVRGEGDVAHRILAQAFERSAAAKGG